MSSVRKRNGKYQAQVRKDGQTVSKTFTSKTDAVKWSKEQEVLIEQGSFTSKKESINISVLLSRWEQEVLNKRNVERYKVAMIDRELGHHFLKKSKYRPANPGA